MLIGKIFQRMVLENSICKRFLSFNTILNDFHCVVAQSWEYYILVFVFIWNFTSFRIFSELLGIFKAKQAMCTWWTSSLEFNSIKVVNDFSKCLTSFVQEFDKITFCRKVRNLLSNILATVTGLLLKILHLSCIPCKLFKVSCITLLLHDYL